MRQIDTVSFLGLGYVGLCTGTVIASKGIQVLGVDVDSDRIEQLRNGKAPFHEPGLSPMLKRAIKKKRIRFTTDASEVAKGQISFITVGTPSNSDGSINLTYVKKAAEDLGSATANADKYHLVVVKSTVVPGTAMNVLQPLLESSSGKKCGDGLGLCSNPEFLAEGTAIKGSLRPDRIVIGSADETSGEVLSRLYRRVYRGIRIPTIRTNTTTAEMIKYSSNAFLATRVSTINSVANVCQRLPGTDVDVVAKAIGLDPRIGPLYLRAGPGYGGSCFHKDLQALVAFSSAIGYDPILLSAVEKVNLRQADEVVTLLEKLLGSIGKRRIAVLGLAFKKDTDDIRESASIRVIDRLIKKGASVSAYDPMAIKSARNVLPDSVELAADSKSALKGADCCIVMTEWDEFRTLKPDDLKSTMNAPNIVDARRIMDLEKFQGFNYAAVGLGPVDP